MGAPTRALSPIALQHCIADVGQNGRLDYITPLLDDAARLVDGSLLIDGSALEDLVWIAESCWWYDGSSFEQWSMWSGQAIVEVKRRRSITSQRVETGARPSESWTIWTTVVIVLIPMIAVSGSGLTAEETELHPAHAHDVVAAESKLDPAVASFVWADLEISALFQASENFTVVDLNVLACMNARGRRDAISANKAGAIVALGAEYRC